MLKPERDTLPMKAKSKSLFSKVVAHLHAGTLGSTLTGRLRWAFASRAERFLDNARGVVHVGANIGQERDTYALCGLPVIWVEPVADIYARLCQNISAYPKQQAFCRLVTDRDGARYNFNIASNGGGSSSIFDLKLHRDIWPNVRFEESVELESITLTTLFAREHLDAQQYDVLVMDTQGSELLVLQGAEAMLGHFHYIRTEAADFEAYAGCCQVDDLVDYLGKHGFRELHRQSFAERAAGGRYYEVLFERKPTLAAASR